MSVFSNPASRSLEEARSYTEAILGLVGSRDPMEILRETPEKLREGIAGLSDAQLGQPEAPGKWSIRQMIQHLADAELVWGYRLRMVLAQDRPPLAGYDQDLWASRLRYDLADVDMALDVSGALRLAHLRLLERATAADLTRTGVHAERGEESVAHMVLMFAGHDLLHLRQLERIRKTVTAGAR
jgi:uncharacterized damage-inducible protein DinB